MAAKRIQDVYSGLRMELLNNARYTGGAAGKKAYGTSGIVMRYLANAIPGIVILQ